MKGHFQARALYARLIAATDGSNLGGMALVGAAQLCEADLGRTLRLRCCRRHAGRSSGNAPGR